MCSLRAELLLSEKSMKNKMRDRIFFPTYRLNCRHYCGNDQHCCEGHHHSVCKVIHSKVEREVSNTNEDKRLEKSVRYVEFHIPSENNFHDCSAYVIDRFRLQCFFLDLILNQFSRSLKNIMK